jgi:arylsulfatase A-like enzyme
MTGMNAAKMGVTNFCSLFKDRPSDAIGGAPGTTNANESDAFANPEWNHNALCPIEFRCDTAVYGLNHTVYATPMVELLRDAGYYTIHVGKAHWAPAGTPGANPLNMGFMVQIAGSGNGHPKSYQPEDYFGNIPGNGDFSSIQNMAQYYDSHIHLNEALTLEALKTLETPIRRNEPFYLYMSHYSVHTPIQRDNRFIQKYLDAGLEENAARYASMVESMDKSLGDIIDYMARKGIADNTIIIFYSDNGGHCLAHDKGDEPHTQNLPLREGKGSCYEGGIRVPMIVYWPGKVAPGTRINTPVINEDFFPSILEMAGVTGYTTYQEIDGQSFVKLIQRGSQLASDAQKSGKIKTMAEANAFIVPTSETGIDPERELVFHYPHQYRVEDQDDIDFLSAMRRGDWKIVYRMHTGELELYNLRNDIGEHNNVAAANPKLTADMAKRLASRLRDWHASMPTVRATGQQVSWPDEVIKPTKTRHKSRK